MNNFLNWAALPKQDYDHDLQTKVVGWGSVYTSESNSIQILKQVNVKIVQNEYCDLHEDRSFICAISEELPSYNVMLVSIIDIVAIVPHLIPWTNLTT